MSGLSVLTIVTGTWPLTELCPSSIDTSTAPAEPGCDSASALTESTDPETLASIPFGALTTLYVKSFGSSPRSWSVVIAARFAETGFVDPASTCTGVGVNSGGRLPEGLTSTGSCKVLTRPLPSLRSFPSVTSRVIIVGPEKSDCEVKVIVRSSV